MEKFFHSVRLETDLCKGCINCLKRCPTEAIRVRDGKANIIKEFCIDCGECIRICPHRAKRATYDPLEFVDTFEYKVVLPPPSLYAQFNNLEDKSLVVNALLAYGFDDVVEVAAGAEINSELTRRMLKEKNVNLPVISTACPAVSRLIRVKFPNLIDLLSPISSPMQIAAEIAEKRALEKTGLPRHKIGVFFITPCPAKVTSVYMPLRREKSSVDGVIAMSDIYPKLLPKMKDVYLKDDVNYENNIGHDNYVAGRIGISWGREGGEAGGLLIDNYLSADGIENVIRVLEELEDEKLRGIEFIEFNACNGGCVGGVLAVENPYIAKAKINKLRKYLPISGTHISGELPPDAYRAKKVEFTPVFNLGDTVEKSIELMTKIDELVKKFPSLDCGCCGAPTCRAHAEDVAKGLASEKDCIHILKEYVTHFEEGKSHDD